MKNRPDQYKLQSQFSELLIFNFERLHSIYPIAVRLPLIKHENLNCVQFQGINESPKVVHVTVKLLKHENDSIDERCAHYHNTDFKGGFSTDEVSIYRWRSLFLKNICFNYINSRDFLSPFSIGFSCTFSTLIFALAATSLIQSYLIQCVVMY